MKNSNKLKLFIRGLLVVSLCLSVLFVQMFQFHMHIGHAENVSEHGHLVNIHMESTSHAVSHDTIYQNDTEVDHSAELDINPVAVKSKIDLSKLYLVFLIILTVAFLGFRTRNTFSAYNRKLNFTSLYYLLNPPLRAPPQ